MQPGDTVVVFGCGGVGINAVQLASAAGGSVIAVDINARKLAWAKEFGAAETINAAQVDRVSKSIKKLTGGGAYVVVTPNRLYGPHDISRHFSDRPLGFHLREYTHVELAAELERAGFDPVLVMRRIGEPPRAGSWRRVAAAERFLDALPAPVRRWFLERAPREEPFRPLEQVKLVGFRPEGRG